MTSKDSLAQYREISTLSPTERFWRNRFFARIRHYLTWIPRVGPFFTSVHALMIRFTGGRIRRSFIFTGGMPILILTTVGRKSGRARSTPLGYLKHRGSFAVIASKYMIKARRAIPEENEALWTQFARLNPGFDEYRNLSKRSLPVILLEPVRNSDAINSDI